MLSHQVKAIKCNMEVKIFCKSLNMLSYIMYIFLICVIALRLPISPTPVISEQSTYFYIFVHIILKVAIICSSKAMAICMGIPYDYYILQLQDNALIYPYLPSPLQCCLTSITHQYQQIEKKNLRNSQVL